MEGPPLPPFHAASHHNTPRDRPREHVCSMPACTSYARGMQAAGKNTRPLHAMQQLTYGIVHVHAGEPRWRVCGGPTPHLQAHVSCVPYGSALWGERGDIYSGSGTSPPAHTTSSHPQTLGQRLTRAPLPSSSRAVQCVTLSLSDCSTSGLRARHARHVPATSD